MNKKYVYLLPYLFRDLIILPYVSVFTVRQRRERNVSIELFKIQIFLLFYNATR